MKMTTKPDIKPTVTDPQVRPLRGEVSLEDARRKALHFAVVEKLRADASKRGSDARAVKAQGNASSKG